MYFRNYGLRKMSLDNCLKRPVSENPSTSNMVNVLKSCWNLNDNTFTIIFDNCDNKRVGNSLS